MKKMRFLITAKDVFKQQARVAVEAGEGVCVGRLRYML